MADDIDKPTIEDIVLVDMANRGLVARHRQAAAME
jgi:hypothetical protein